MKATKETMDVIFVINNGLIDMKLKLLEAEKLAVTTEEKIDIIAVRKKVQEGIQEILHNFFPKTEFNEQEWLTRRRSTDAGHKAKMNQIIKEAVDTGAYGDSEGKPTCHFDYSDDGVAKTWKDE
jgi:hypothetical protein